MVLSDPIKEEKNVCRIEKLNVHSINKNKQKFGIINDYIFKAELEFPKSENEVVSFKGS